MRQARRPLVKMRLATALSLMSLLLKTAVGGREKDPCEDGSCPSPTYQAEEEDAESCGLWLGPSPIKEHEEHGFGLGMFTGRLIQQGEEVGPEVVIPLFDSNLDHDYPPLHEYTWEGENMPELPLESKDGTFLFLPGLAAIAPCTGKNFNLALKWNDDYRKQSNPIVADSAGVHRTSDPAAGSFSYRHNFTFTAVRDIVPGEELTVQCSDDDFDGGAYYLSRYSPSEAVICLDQNVQVDISKATKGRGLFAKRRLSQDSIVLATPMVPLHRKELEMAENRKQLLLNYCYGQANSDLLLLPFGPLANHLNHAPESVQPNVRIQWHTSTSQENLAPRQQHNHPELLELSGDTVAYTHGKGLIMDIVALRDIEPGEELYLDYGTEWLEAWKRHLQNWKPIDQGYISAAEYNRVNDRAVLRTVDEQEENPYPSNLQTACYYASEWQEDENDNTDGDPTKLKVSWTRHEEHECIVPCQVLDRHSRDLLYTVRLLPVDNSLLSFVCAWYHPMYDHVMTDVPRHGIKFLDRPYTSDTFLKQAFRHEIGVPEGFYPDMWMQKKMRRREQQIFNEGEEFKRKKPVERKVALSE